LVLVAQIDNLDLYHLFLLVHRAGRVG
jgi:hypothetical protein